MIVIAPSDPVAGDLLPLGSMLAFHAARDPDSPAVTCDGVTITHAALDARSNRKARHLARHGVGAQDIVTVALPNGLEFYETAFAIWKLGATINPISSKLPAAEIAAIIGLARPVLVVGVAPGEGASWPYLAAGAEPDPDLSDAPLPAIIPTIWRIMTSGGSTGRPKLIVDRKPGLFDPMKPDLLMTQGETMLNPGPLYHSSPLVMTTSCIATGGHVVEMGRFDALRALELIERHRVGWVNLVPTMMHRIARLPADQRLRFDVSSLRVVFHMAAPCPVWLKEQWIAWLGPEKIFELYGGTELFGTTLITGPEWLTHRGSVGRVVPGAQMCVLDDRGRRCAPGAVGEIHFRPDVPRDPDAIYIGASPALRDGWLSYGDLGHMDAEGYLYLVERRTDLILSGGANIYPAEVEAALDRHPDVHSSIVVGLPDEDLGQRVHAIVQLAPDAGARTDADALRAFLADRLVRYKIPRSFEFTTQPLRDDAGKARRTKLRDDRIATGAQELP